MMELQQNKKKISFEVISTDDGEFTAGADILFSVENDVFKGQRLTFVPSYEIYGFLEKLKTPVPKDQIGFQSDNATCSFLIKPKDSAGHFKAEITIWDCVYGHSNKVSVCVEIATQDLVNIRKQYEKLIKLVPRDDNEHR